MANLKLNNVVALSETGGVATFGTSSSTLKYPAGHIIQVQHTTYPSALSIVASATNSFVDWSTVVKGTMSNVLASSHILITIMYSPASVDGEAIFSRVEKSDDGTDSGTFSAVEGTGDDTGSMLAQHDGTFVGASNIMYDHDRHRRSIQIIDTSPRTGTNQYRFRSTNSQQYTGTMYLARNLAATTWQYNGISPTTFNLMEISQ